MAKSVKERASDLRQRKGAAGLRQVNLWVPADQVEWIRTVAADLVAGRPADPAPQPPPPPPLPVRAPAPSPAGKRKICYGIVFSFPDKPVSKAFRTQLQQRNFERDDLLGEWLGSIFPEDYPELEKLVVENGGVIVHWAGAKK